MAYEIKPGDGSRSGRKRLGRGPGSGTGKTSGKGHKGQRARSGHKQRAWFEGGQMPLQRRVPKRGFKNPHRTPYQVVNVSDLEGMSADKIDKQTLHEVGLIRHAEGPVKVLGGGELTRKVDVAADAFSAAARQAIESAGGTWTATEATPARKRRFEKKSG